MFNTSDNKDKRLREPRFMVYWRARCMLSDRSLYPSVIKTASPEGFGFEMQQAVSLHKAVNFEFFVKYRGKETRIRAKTVVIYNMILSESRGAYMEVAIKNMAGDNMHTYNNILQALDTAKEFDLKI